MVNEDYERFSVKLPCGKHLVTGWCNKEGKRAAKKFFGKVCPLCCKAQD